MVSDNYLKNYARKIYERVPGYTFEKVRELSPKYLPAIQYYYDLIKREAEDGAMNNLRNVVYYSGGMEALVNINQYMQALQSARAHYDMNFADYKEARSRMDEIKYSDKYPPELIETLIAQEESRSRRSATYMAECRAEIRGLKAKMNKYLQALDELAYDYEFADISNKIKQARDFLLEDITGE